MEPSQLAIGMLEELEEKFSEDAFRLCIEIEKFIQILADDLKDENHSFVMKFQIIADLKFASDYLEALMSALNDAFFCSDSFHELLSYMDEGEPS